NSVVVIASRCAHLPVKACARRDPCSVPPRAAKALHKPQPHGGSGSTWFAAVRARSELQRPDLMVSVLQTFNDAFRPGQLHAKSPRNGRGRERYRTARTRSPYPLPSMPNPPMPKGTITAFPVMSVEAE